MTVEGTWTRSGTVLVPNNNGLGCLNKPENDQKFRVPLDDGYLPHCCMIEISRFTISDVT